MSIPETEKNALKNPEPLSESYTENTQKCGNFFIFISPAFSEPVSTVLLLLETAAIAPFWAMIQLEAFLSPLLATVLLLTEQFNQCLPNIQHKHSAMKFYTLLTENCPV